MEILITLGINKQLNFWLLQGGKYEMKYSVPLPKVPSCMDVDLSSNIIAMGLEQDIGIYPLERLQSNNTEVKLIDPMLKSPINCIAIRGPSQNNEGLFLKDQRTIVACATDGRAWVGKVKLNATFNKEDIVLYKAHSKNMNLACINGVGFSKLYHYSMYTIGSEGTIQFWNIDKKNRLSSYTLGDTVPFTCVDLSPDQKYMVLAIGYDWSQGIWGTAKLQIRPKIFIYETVQKDHKVEKR